MYFPLPHCGSNTNSDSNGSNSSSPSSSNGLITSLNERLVAVAPELRSLEAKTAEVEIALQKVGKEKLKMKKSSIIFEKFSFAETKSSKAEEDMLSSTTEEFRKAATHAIIKEAELQKLISATSASTGMSKTEIVSGLKFYLIIKSNFLQTDLV